MTECKPCVTLMEERLKLTKASTTVKVDATLYRSIGGGLRYLVHMRSDIMFVVGYVSHFMEDPQEDHWATVKRLLCSVKGTVDQVIVFPKIDESGLLLTVFSDADMAGDINGRRSTSGVLVFLRSALISWLSLKQKVVALSTCKADNTGEVSIFNSVEKGSDDAGFHILQFIARPSAPYDCLEAMNAQATWS
ncbi:secreted RxLR effector protein 161-like [Miscanthus floridulus]|uniref:secreted RxLR effector protein 161-like n=1 Tax=Miscanthus floridulus TaxID=154761 RepID=UPI00345A7BA7